MAFKGMEMRPIGCTDDDLEYIVAMFVISNALRNFTPDAKYKEHFWWNKYVKVRGKHSRIN